MATHYLIDAYTTPVTNSRVNDVKFSPYGNASEINGTFVIRVDDGLDIRADEVWGLTDLVSQKNTEILASYPGFSSMVYDDMLDPTGIDTANSYGVCMGDRVTTSFAPSWLLGPPDPSLRTSMVSLGGTPSECVVTWECFYIDREVTNPRDGRLVRKYVEYPSAVFNCSVSFNNWSTSNTVTDGSLLNIPLADQGNQLVLRFEPNGVVAAPSLPYGALRVYLGYWAVIY